MPGVGDAFSSCFSFFPPISNCSGGEYYFQTHTRGPRGVLALCCLLFQIFFSISGCGRDEYLLSPQCPLSRERGISLKLED